MELFKIVGLVVLFGMLGWGVGLLSVEFGIPGGMKSVRRSGVVGGLVVAALSWLAGALLLNPLAAIFMALGCWSAASWSARYYGDNLELDIQKALSMASTVSDYLLNRFDRLDLDGDGLIMQADLEEGESRDTWDKYLLQHIVSRIGDIGHIVGSRQEITAVSAIGGMPTVVHVPVYGINREDLGTYERRLREKHKNWL